LANVLTIFDMGKEDFIKDAQFKPDDYIAYHVARELAELHPEKAIIEGQSGYFDLEEFVRAERCSIVSESSVFNHTRTFWDGVGKPSKDYMENAWLNVLWRGHLLDVVLITWAEDAYRSRHHWIVSESRQLAEAFFAEVCEWSSEIRGEILVFQDGYWEKNEDLYTAIKIASFDNVILSDSLKQQVQDDFEQFFNSQELYKQFGIPWKRGALFIGPPGNGKTHTVKALINQLARPCLYVKGFKSECATEQENIGLVFERARLATPCLLVLEDLDSMIDDQNRSFFLNELDGFENNSGLVVLATTNHPDKLDPAISDRPSRFDRKYYFNLPAAAERLAYIEGWNKQLQPELRLSATAAGVVVQQTENFSFAYLKELFVSSTMQWMTTRRELLVASAVQADVGERARNESGLSAIGTMNEPGLARGVSMDEIVLEQVGQLLKQMTAISMPQPTPSSPTLVWRNLSRAIARMRAILS
jgi:AAA+ superfamily predicted ATPase